MRINWKLRLQNKTTLVALLTAVVAFVYQILGIVGVTAPISQDSIVQVIGVLVNVLVALGVVVDPTTAGVSDSVKAQNYSEPSTGTEYEAVSSMASDQETNAEDSKLEAEANSEAMAEVEAAYKDGDLK